MSWVVRYPTTILLNPPNFVNKHSIDILMNSSWVPSSSRNFHFKNGIHFIHHVLSPPLNHPGWRPPLLDNGQCWIESWRQAYVSSYPAFSPSNKKHYSQEHAPSYTTNIIYQMCLWDSQYGSHPLWHPMMEYVYGLRCLYPTISQTVIEFVEMTHDSWYVAELYSAGDRSVLSWVHWWILSVYICIKELSNSRTR